MYQKVTKTTVLLIVLSVFANVAHADPPPQYPHPNAYVLYQNWTGGRYIVATWDEGTADVTVWSDSNNGCTLKYETSTGETKNWTVVSYRGLSAHHFENVTWVKLSSTCFIDNVVVEGRILYGSGGGHAPPVDLRARETETVTGYQVVERNKIVNGVEVRIK